MKRRKPKVVGTLLCSDKLHAVVTLKTEASTDSVYRREVCEECPWRRDLPTHRFPPDAFRHSARTCEDMAQATFACHRM